MEGQEKRKKKEKRNKKKDDEPKNKAKTLLQHSLSHLSFLPSLISLSSLTLYTRPRTPNQPLKTFPIPIFSLTRSLALSPPLSLSPSPLFRFPSFLFLFSVHYLRHFLHGLLHHSLSLLWEGRSLFICRAAKKLAISLPLEKKNGTANRSDHLQSVKNIAHYKDIKHEIVTVYTQALVPSRSLFYKRTRCLPTRLHSKRVLTSCSIHERRAVNRGYWLQPQPDFVKARLRLV